MAGSVPLGPRLGREVEDGVGFMFLPLASSPIAAAMECEPAGCVEWADAAA